MTQYPAWARLVRVDGKPGRIVARTHEQSPRYDVRLEDGTIAANVAADKLGNGDERAHESIAATRA